MSTRLRLSLPVVVGLAAVTWWDWLAALLSAPWVAALAWVILRNGAIVPDEELPSAAETARRRLSTS